MKRLSVLRRLLWLPVLLYIFWRSEGQSLRPYACDGGNPGA